LRTGQNLNAFDISCVDIQVTTRLGQRLLVEIEADVRRKASHTGNRQIRRGRSQTADIDRVLAGAGPTCRHPWQLNQIVGEILDAEFLELLLTERSYSNRHILRAFCPLRRGDGHRLQAFGAGSFSWCILCQCNWRDQTGHRKQRGSVL